MYRPTADVLMEVKIASPSAPPTCCIVLTMADATPESSWSTPSQ